MNIEPKWSTLSVAFYVFLAYIGAFSIKMVKQYEQIRGKRLSNVNRWYRIWGFLWVFFAAFRLININGVGGADAFAYITYFDNCLNPYYEMYSHYGIVWRYICIIIKKIFIDYHLFLFIYHGFLVYSYQKFINEFMPPSRIASPMILVFFIFLRGFNTFRTNVSVALILLAIVYLYQKKYLKVIIFLVLSVNIQVASLIYCAFVPFYYLFKNGRLSLKGFAIISFFVAIAAPFVRDFFINYIGRYLGHAYLSYAMRSIGHSFFENYWKIAFDQLLLAAAVIIYNKQITNRIKNYDTKYSNKVYLIWTMCLFDFSMIPVSFTMSIWRAYEYFYIPRLIMWNEIIDIIRIRYKLKRKNVETIANIAFIAWLVFRIANTWQDSRYLPYVFTFSSLKR